MGSLVTSGRAPWPPTPRVVTSTEVLLASMAPETIPAVPARQGYVEKLMSFNRKVGELETKLLQLEGPSGTVGAN